MRKKILVATSALALTAGTVFAMSGDQTISRASDGPCPPECCNGNSEGCGPASCDKSGNGCCDSGL